MKKKNLKKFEKIEKKKTLDKYFLFKFIDIKN